MKLKSFVMVEENDNYLLICESSAKWKGQWYLPGGNVLKKEDPQVAVLRETTEETGLRVTLTGIFYFCFHAAMIKPELDIFYCGRPSAGKLKTSKDKHSSGAGWFSYEEILGLPLRGNALEVINAYRNSQAEIPAHHFCFEK